MMGPALQGFSAGESRAGEAGKPGPWETKAEKCVCSEESTFDSSCKTKESLVAIAGVDLSEGSRHQLVEELRGEEGPTLNIGSLLQRRIEVLDQIASLLTLRLLLRHGNSSMKPNSRF